MAELIGMLGSSGFIGMAIGPTLADLVFGSGEVTRTHVQRMFLLAGTMGMISFACAALATGGHIRPPRKKKPPAIWLIRRYHPGVLLLVAAAMGLGIGLPGTFLRPYAESLGVAGIKTYFLVYTATAFVVRIAARRMPEQYGNRPFILAGLSSLAGSMLLYLLAADIWSLAIPAVLAGVAHAFLFPSVMSGGSLTFPPRYRGLATTLMLSMFDLGMLIGQPAVGGILELSRGLGWLPYPTMFVSVAAVIALIGVIYAAASCFQRPSRAANHKRTEVSADSAAADKRNTEQVAVD